MPAYARPDVPPPAPMLAILRCILVNPVTPDTSMSWGLLAPFYLLLPAVAAAAAAPPASRRIPAMTVGTMSHLV